jgi:hypothetical protein
MRLRMLGLVIVAVGFGAGGAGAEEERPARFALHWSGVSTHGHPATLTGTVTIDAEPGAAFLTSAVGDIALAYGTPFGEFALDDLGTILVSIFEGRIGEDGETAVLTDVYLLTYDQRRGFNSSEFGCIAPGCTHFQMRIDTERLVDGIDTRVSRTMVFDFPDADAKQAAFELRALPQADDAS